MQTTETNTPLRADDFINLDAMLTAEERQLRDKVRRFVSEQVLPYVGCRRWPEASCSAAGR